MKKDLTRRSFLEFVGKSIFLSQPLLSLSHGSIVKPEMRRFTPLKPQLNDELVFSPEISYYSLIQRGKPIGKNLNFGDNNDYLAYFPFTKTEGLLWVNHEFPEMELLLEEFGSKTITKEIVEESKKRVGGSFIKIKINADAQFEYIQNDPLNRRLDANTPIPIISKAPILRRSFAIGTLANCAGGVTPWKTLLSCEENYDGFVGEVEFDQFGKRTYIKKSRYGWTKFESFIPEHYGWVVEVNPLTGKSKKLTALGRFCHEGALTVVAKDGRTVVYMGDDRENQFIYKFISKNKNSLDEGELFAADTINGQWLSLDITKSEILQKNFKNQTDVLIQTRKAATLLGATPQDRPEGMALHPQTGEIFISCTTNKINQPFGKILKLTEAGNNYLSLTFKTTNFMIGSKQFHFACPDNLIFDPQGNLWCTTDTSGKDQNKGPYISMGGNALYVIPTSGNRSGVPIRVGSAPAGAEFTGPIFIDQNTMMICLQHPGEHMNQKSQWQSQVLVLNFSLPRGNSFNRKKF